MLMKIATICEPIVQTLWDSQHLTTLQASTVCYRDTFTLLLLDCKYCYK
jgi:hypothetical protein